MKVYSVLLIIVFSLTTNSFSQVDFTPHTITTSADYANSVYAVDVDGDGDMDVLSASYVDDKIAWYENLSTVGIINNDPPVVPVKLLLYNNYPNPFNPITTIQYDLPTVNDVKIVIYNLMGQEIRQWEMQGQTAGTHKVIWDAINDQDQSAGAGIYFYRLQADDFVLTRKMVLLR